MQAKNQSSSPWFYLILWFFFVYLFVQILSFNQGTNSNLLLSGLYFIQFGVHEAAHIVFGFLPSIMVAAAGSISEIIFTLLIIIAAVKARAKFAAIFGALWMMLAMASAGNYMADARAQAMPLIGPGDTVTHDWNYVFGQLGWLNADRAIGGTVKGVGVAIGAAALAYGLYLIIVMLIEPKASEGV